MLFSCLLIESFLSSSLACTRTEPLPPIFKKAENKLIPIYQFRAAQSTPEMAPHAFP